MNCYGCKKAITESDSTNSIYDLEFHAGCMYNAFHKFYDAAFKDLNEALPWLKQHYNIYEEDGVTNLKDGEKLQSLISRIENRGKE